MNCDGFDFNGARFDFRRAIYCYKVILDQCPFALHEIERLFALGSTSKQQVLELLNSGWGSLGKGKDSASEIPDWMSHLVDAFDFHQHFNFTGIS